MDVTAPVEATPEGAERRRTLESVIEELDGRDATELARAWPIHGVDAGPYDERRYQEACRAEVVPAHILCRREDFLRCGDGEFVAAAFRIIAGEEPDRSIWHHHVNRLASGEATRADLLTELQASPAGRARQVIIFDHGQLRPLAEMTGVGLRELAQVLLGMARPRTRRRLGLALDRLLKSRR